ncbi:MAG: hypothetical protein ABEJ98_01430 [Candidatus Nanohaloarchaea archaeon]
MEDHDETPALGIGFSHYEVPEDDPVLYIETASTQGFGSIEPEQDFQYTASWQQDIDESTFEQLFHDYAADGELFEARSPRQLFGYNLPLTKKVGEIGVNREEPRHQADYFRDGDFILAVPSTDTDPLRYYFPETVELEEEKVVEVLEEAEDAISEADVFR